MVTTQERSTLAVLTAVLVVTVKGSYTRQRSQAVTKWAVCLLKERGREGRKEKRRKEGQKEGD